jgi:hypothetical protein
MGVLLLPGWSAKQLLLRGGFFELIAILAGMACGTEGILPGEWWYWALLFGSLCLTAVTIGLICALRGYKKEKMEMTNGYTTLWKTAVEHPELHFLTGDMTAVISEPRETRPRSTRRKDMAAYLKARQHRSAPTLGMDGRART